jgi:hypothetical protein
MRNLVVLPVQDETAVQRTSARCLSLRFPSAMRRYAARNRDSSNGYSTMTADGLRAEGRPVGVGAISVAGSLRGEVRDWARIGHCS